MEVSPLVQDARPPTFQPKVTQLYEELFVDEDSMHSEGFWTELFLLRPDRISLGRRLEQISADDFLHYQHEAQELFIQAIAHIKAGKTPSDEIALDTLTVFLAGVLSKRYTNPSSDIIEVLAGLDRVDSVFTEFANVLEVLIRNGRSLDLRRRAIQVALSLTSGAYQTSLVSYFTHRDLFPALMKYIQDTGNPADIFEPVTLLGLLANYNKFEYRNPYRLRLEDFVNEAIIQKIASGLSSTCATIRNAYTEVIDDLPPDPSWSLANTLSYIGLGMLAPIKAINPIAPLEDHKERFGVLPGPEVAILLAVYDFVNANKFFTSSLFQATGKDDSPFTIYLSMISYLLHHAYRSTRATLYGILCLSTLRIVIEDPVACKKLCDPTITITVQLCRQRPPTLPLTPQPRPAAAQILDICIDTINHNLRRRLDLDLYTAALHLIHRLLICLSQNHIHLPYHWSLLWASLLSLTKFIQTYSTDILAQPTPIRALTTPLFNTLALSIAAGNSFLPDPHSYDDLFYKLVESAPILTAVRKTFSAALTSSDSPLATAPPTTSTSSLQRLPIDILLTTANHFHAILEQNKTSPGGSGGGMRSLLNTRDVNRAIRSGYESLEVPDTTGMSIESFEVWREGEERGLLKRVARAVVEDVRRVVG